MCMYVVLSNKQETNKHHQAAWQCAGKPLEDGGRLSETAAPSQGSPGVILPSGLLPQHSSRPRVEPWGGCWRQGLGRERRDCEGWCNYPEIVGIIFCHLSAHIRCKEAGERTWPACNFPSTPNIGSSSFVFPTPCLFSPRNCWRTPYWCWSLVWPPSPLVLHKEKASLPRFLEDHTHGGSLCP